MIQEMQSAFKGVVNINIENIKSSIVESIYHRLDNFEIPNEKEEKQSWQEHDADLRMLFGNQHITLNSKNIEYEESFCLSDYVMNNHIKDVLFYFDWTDLDITLTVYRLGQYSYYNVKVDYVMSEI